MIIESRYITHPLNHQRLSLVAPLEWFRECVVEVFIQSDPNLSIPEALSVAGAKLRCGSALLARRLLKRASSKSIDGLRQRIPEFIECQARVKPELARICRRLF